MEEYPLCFECGEPFANDQEWDNRHSYGEDDNFADVHDRCCRPCHQGQPHGDDVLSNVLRSGLGGTFLEMARTPRKVLTRYCVNCSTGTEHSYLGDVGRFEQYRCHACNMVHSIAVR